MELEDLATMRDSMITAIVTTFERPQSCLRLIGSARTFCPDLRLLVVDDSRNPGEWPEADDVLTMPFDSGLSAKRNAGVRRVGSGWVVIMDDDFVCLPQTNVQRLVEVAEATGLDIVGGEVLNPDAPMRYHGYFDRQDDHVTVRSGWETVDGANRCNLIPNFFVARAETLAAHPWDDDLKLAEHSAFFYTHRDALKVGWVQDVAIRHVQERPADYVAYRERGIDIFQGWLNRNRLGWTDMRGTVMRWVE